MATFGNTANGTNVNGGNAGYTIVSSFTTPDNGTITDLECWVQPVTADISEILAIWADSAGLPGALLAQTAAITAPVASGIQQIAGPLLVNYVMTAGQLLWLGVSSGGAGDMTIRTVTGGNWRYRGVSTPSNPFGASVNVSGSTIPIAAIYTPKPPPRSGFASFQDPAVFMRRRLSGLLAPDRKIWLPA